MIVHSSSLFLSLILHNILLRGTIVTKDLVQNPWPILNLKNMLSLQRFLVVFHGTLTSDFYFSVHRRALSRVCIPRKYKVTSGIFHGVPQNSAHIYFKPCHGKYSDNTINATYARRMMERLHEKPLNRQRLFSILIVYFLWHGIKPRISPSGRLSLPSSSVTWLI